MIVSYKIYGELFVGWTMAPSMLLLVIFMLKLLLYISSTLECLMSISRILGNLDE